MQICIVSDSHDNRRLLDIAVKDAKQRGAEAVLHCGDVVAPTPSTMTFAVAPTNISDQAISMTATTATDASAVEYFFTCTAGGGHRCALQARAPGNHSQRRREIQLVSRGFWWFPALRISRFQRSRKTVS